MSYFDKDGTGEINCKEFLIQFTRTGFEERNNLRRSWREEQKKKELMIKQGNTNTSTNTNTTTNTSTNTSTNANTNTNNLNPFIIILMLIYRGRK